MFDWYKKERLEEQLKFFGGKRKGFVSCYSNEFKIKPRIRLENKKILDLNPRYAIGSSHQLIAQQQAAQFDALRGNQGAQLAGLMSAAGAQQSALGMANDLQAQGMGAANQAHRFGMEAARGDILSMLEPALQANRTILTVYR